jgi:hypothetical protein
MNLSSETLRKAADIQDQIERLQSELNNVLSGNGVPAAEAAREEAPSAVVEPSIERPARRRRKKIVRSEVPLSEAVVKILQRAHHPLKVRKIYERLVKSGYPFQKEDPRENIKLLGVRIYNLKGVKQTGPGLFTAE